MAEVFGGAGPEWGPDRAHEVVETQPVGFGPSIRRGSLEFDRCADTTYLLETTIKGYADALAGRRGGLMLTGYRKPGGSELLKQRLAWMKIGVDPREDDGPHINSFEDLIGPWDERRNCLRHWVGPISVSALRRVLQGKIEWGVPDPTLNDHDVIAKFEAASVEGTDGVTVRTLLRSVLSHNAQKQFDREKPWGIEMERVIATGGGGIIEDRLVAPPIEPASLWDPQPLLNLVNRVRAAANALIFDSARHPDVVPREPGLLLASASALHYLLIVERKDDDVPMGVVLETAYAPWQRVVRAAYEAFEPTPTFDEAESQQVEQRERETNRRQAHAKRLGQQFPWFRDYVESTLAGRGGAA